MTATYILRALDKDGNESFYTGRAGSAFVGPEETEAFPFQSLAVARGRASRFNDSMPVHGLRFVAIEV